MKDFKNRTYLFALLIVLALFAGCKGETPTAPPPSSGPGTGPGGGTPPVGATVTLTVSNPNPLANSSSTVTATVTSNNQPVPNGTAVEFGTTHGTFTENGQTTIIKTTTNGVATATVTASTAGTANITAVVNNVVARTTITFQAAPVVPPPAGGPTITGVSPSSGRPEGGEIITVSGTNFRAPVRVFFSIEGRLIEGFVANVAPNALQVVTPPVNLGTGQTAAATIVVLNEAGTPSETRISGSTFTFRRATLTPVVRAVSPASGPLEGGTRVTIFGDAFEAPTQIFFGLAEAQIINVTFDQIVAISPPARDASPDGSAIVTGPINIRIKNIASNTEVTASGAFRYMPNMVITAVAPTEGPFTGGTRVTIDGTGFDDPVAVEIGGVAAQPIRVNGTQIVAVTTEVRVQGCADVTGPVSVTNINTGASADSSVIFTYLVPRPIIVSVTGPTTPGGSIQVRVLNAFGFPRLRIGDAPVNITAETVNADGSTTFTVTVPTTLVLNTTACPGTNVNAPAPTLFDVTYESATTGCTTTFPRGLLVNPPPGPLIAVNPLTFTPFQANFTAGTPGPPPTAPTLVPSSPQTLNLVNVGNTTPLTVTGVATAGTGCAQFSIGTAVTPIDLNQCEPFPITVIYNGADPTPQPSVTHSCTLTITTNAGNRTFTLVGTTQ